MISKVAYYVVHPNGREKLGENISPEEANRLFADHWTAKAHWVVDGGTRKLVRTLTETIIEETERRK